MDTIHFLSEDQLFLRRPDWDHVPSVNMVPAAEHPVLPVKCEAGSILLIPAGSETDGHAGMSIR